MFDADSIANVAWHSSVDAIPDNSTRIPVNPCAAKRRIRNNFLRLRYQERLCNR